MYIQFVQLPQKEEDEGTVLWLKTEIEPGDGSLAQNAQKWPGEPVLLAIQAPFTLNVPENRPPAHSSSFVVKVLVVFVAFPVSAPGESVILKRSHDKVSVLDHMIVCCGL